MVATSVFGPAVRRCHDAIVSLGFSKAIEPLEDLVIYEDKFFVRARGIIWDCRDFAHGLPAVSMNFSAAPASVLNNDFIRPFLSDWPDQKLVSFLLGGLKFRAQLLLRFLFMPHLGSITNA
jgi:hypothetical protein